MPKFEIEDNLPVPETRGRKGVTNEMPFDELQVGQSFRVSKETAAFRTVQNAAYRWRDRLGRNFHVVSEHGGCRVFRMPDTDARILGEGEPS